MIDQTDQLWYATPSGMNEKDDFGRDPAVQAMRQTFSAMEKAQQHLLEAAASKLDEAPSLANRR
jgi:hypothetical protein